VKGQVNGSSPFSTNILKQNGSSLPEMEEEVQDISAEDGRPKKSLLPSRMKLKNDQRVSSLRSR